MQNRQPINRTWFEERGLYSPDDFHHGVWLYSLFLCFGMGLVFASRFTPSGRYQSAFVSAANEGLGPNLWNAFGLLGVMLLGLAILCPALITAARASKALLEGAFGIGAGMTGIIIGGLLIQAPEVYSSNGTSWVLFWAIVCSIGILCIAMLNMGTWCLALLPYANSKFALWLSTLKLSQRIMVGLGLIFIAIMSFLAQP